MAVPRIYLKNFSRFKGLDLKSSDLTRSSLFSSDMKNVDISKADALIKRKGYQYKLGNTGGIGLHTYKNINTTTGVVTDELVTLDQNLYTLTADSFNVTYSGSGTALLNITVNSAGTALALTITEDGTELLNQNLGIGADEAAAVAISTVISSIDALTDFAASGGTITTGSSAFLDVQKDTVLTSTATAINYKRWTQVNTPTSNPLSTTYGNRSDDDFENPSAVNLNNVIYISSPNDNLHKYDGQTFYRAGMPAGGDADGSGDAGTAPTTAEDTAGSTFAQTQAYYYKFLYKQVDNKGNIVEGIMSPVSAQETIADASGADIDITITNISSSSGFNTGCAIVNGAQNGVTTITVDSGHTLNSGDTAYFYDGNTSAYVTKTLTSTTATSITFSGSVDVADNAVISNNLRIAIYRTDNGGASDGTYSLVAEIPNDSINATQVYKDQITDANKGAEFVEPVKPHNLPPKGRYMTKFRNQLLICGDITNVNTVYYSDIDSPEYFPTATNSFLVDAYPGSQIRGIGSLESQVVIFKDASVISVSGEIGLDSFRTDEVPFGEVGCASHNSIQQISGALFFLSNRGVFAMDPSRGVVPVGDLIESEFTAYNSVFALRRATSINWRNQNEYLLFVPSETDDSSNVVYANTNSKVYVYNYARNAWLKWDNINAHGGFSLVNNDIYFQSKRLDSDSSNSEVVTSKFHNSGNNYDYCDHISAVDFDYKTNWESLGEPNLFKKFLRLKVFSLPSDIIDSEVPLFTLTIDTEFNFQTPAVIDTFTQDFSGGTTGWGNGEWGNFPWGDNALPELKGKLKVIKGRSIRLIFRNNTRNQDILISGFELEVAASFIPHMKE